MRFTNVLTVLAVGAVCAPALIVGCGGDEASTGSGTPSGSGASSGGNAGFPCTPDDPVCTKVKSDCISLEDNSAKTSFGLRMAQLTITKPEVLGKGAVGTIVSNGLTMNLDQCNLGGGGTFSWLLQFDTGTGKLLTGGAEPATDPTAGYCFVNKTLDMFPIAPVDVEANLMGGKFTAKSPKVVVPIFLDDAATSYVLMPLNEVTLSGDLSADNNCIGSFNDETLKTEDNCHGTATNPAFTNAGNLEGFITLEDADKVVVESLGQSLCVLLSGNPGMYGEGSPALCKRDANMKIMFQGDWCSTTNMAADAMCADSSKLGAAFAASGVKVNGNCQ